MKFIKNWKFLLLLIVVLAAFLRFYQLGTNPPSLTWDESASGYNLYTIVLSGALMFVFMHFRLKKVKNCIICIKLLIE